VDEKNTLSVDQIKESLPPLMDLIGVSGFKKVSDGFQGPHPIHGSQTGMNLHINTAKGVFYCHRCGKGGSSLEWIAIREGFIKCGERITSSAFPEVLKAAAEIAGLSFNLSREQREYLHEFKKEHDLLREIFTATQRFYTSHLRKEHVEFIAHQWGFSEATITKVGFGFAPEDGESLLQYLTQQFDPNDVMRSGLFMQTKRGVKDLFQGRIIIPYPKHGESVFFIGRKTPWTPQWDKPKYRKQQRRSEDHQFVSDLVKEPLYGVDSLCHANKVIITEGITDAIACIENGYTCLSPVTVRFKDDHLPGLKRLTANKTIYVANDNDEKDGRTPGLDGALATLKELHDDSYLVILPRDDGAAKVDLNDYFRNHTPEDFEQLLKSGIKKEEALYYYRGDLVALFSLVLRELSVDPQKTRAIWRPTKQSFDYTDLATILQGITTIQDALAVFRRTTTADSRTPTGVEQELRKRVVARAIQIDLRRYGTFLRDRFDVGYFFDTSAKMLLVITDIEMETLIWKLYGVNQTTKEGQFVLKDLTNFSLEYGGYVQVYRYIHYDEKLKKLYIFNRENHYFVLDGEAICKKENGANNIYFEKRRRKDGKEDSPINYVDPLDRPDSLSIPGEIEQWKGHGSYLHRVMINRTNFSHDTALTPSQQRLQLLLHLYIIPFATFFEVHPIMCFTGREGSGKSFTLRVFGAFFLGTDFKLEGIPKTEEDARVVATHSPLFFIDNVDKPVPWLEDLLATLATGIRYSKRKLWTDFDEIGREPSCFAGITSRSPSFNRPDIVDRMLIFHVKRFPKKNFIPPKVLFEPMKAYQSLLWSFFMDDLNKILKVLQTFSFEEVSSSHRLAGWAVFAQIVAEALDLENEEVQTLLDTMEYERGAFAMKDEPLLPALKLFCNSFENHGEWLSTSELHAALKEVACDIYYYKSPASLGKKLAKYEVSLTQMFGMKRRKNSHTKNWEVCFPTTTKQGLDSFDSNSEDDSSHQNRVTRIRDAIEHICEEDNGGASEQSIIQYCMRHYDMDKYSIKSTLEWMLEKKLVFQTNGKYWVVK